ncbi:MAG: MFS transporter, partial [Proteobacteria bacterium]|nr:MFS transporter [Pseudomonadota bacterium]
MFSDLVCMQTIHPPTTHLLKTRRFLPYFLTQFTGAFNDSLIRRGVEMLIAFKGLSGALSAETAIFLLLALFMLPFFTCSAWGGFLADTMNKERLVRWIKVAEVAIILIAAVGLHAQSLILCALAVLGLGIHSSFFGPVKFSLPPQHVNSDELIAANGLIEAGTNVAILAGTILGSILIMVPSGESYLSALGLLSAAVGLGASMFVPTAPPTEAARGAIRTSTWGLITLLYKDKRLWRLAMGISWFWTVGALLISLFSLIVKDILVAPEYFVTIFFAIFSVGVGAGSIFCNRLLKGHIEATWVPVASLAMAGSMFVFYALLQGPTVADSSAIGFLMSGRGSGIAVTLFTLSFAAGLFIVPLYGLLQHHTSD